MATQNMTLLFRPVLTKIDSIVLDASISENHQSEAEVTEHPVEKGTNIADHARPKQDTLTIEGVISNTPLSHDQQQRTVNAFGTNIVTTGTDAPRGQVGFAEEADRKLLDLKRNARLITIVTQLRTYENMILTSYVVPRDGKTGDVLRFNATFKQIRVVENRSTKIVVSSEPKAQPPVEKGKQVAKTSTEADKNQSWIYDGTDSLGVTGKVQHLLAPPGVDKIGH
jgi:hypothetical protein